MLSDLFFSKVVEQSSSLNLTREKRMEMLKLLFTMVPSRMKSYLVHCLETQFLSLSGKWSRGSEGRERFRENQSSWLPLQTEKAHVKEEVP